MSLFIASLNSGSNANCYYVGNAREAVLVDAGLSCRETERRMRKLGLDMERVKALFISHEHADHIAGMSGLSKKYRLPVYITPPTLQQSGMPLEPELVRGFRHGKPLAIGSLEVTPFRKSHDAADPHSFLISGSGVEVGVITDIGYACKRVLKHFAKCQAVFLESNYCEEMLEQGSYPYHLKKRIRGDEGHLSNDQALELFREYRSPNLQLLILSHLSKNNNHPDVVKELFSPHAGTTEIFIASRYEESPLFEVKRKGMAEVKVEVKNKAKKEAERQLKLF